MKQIINGLRYDTDKARKLGEYSQGGVGDFSAYDEALYVTPKGRYFLAGSGGPNTKYAEVIDVNSRRGGWRIIPLSTQEAFEWAQYKLTPEETEALFAASIQDA